VILNAIPSLDQPIQAYTQIRKRAQERLHSLDDLHAPNRRRITAFVSDPRIATNYATFPAFGCTTHPYTIQQSP
jgi:hypothetical protein